jgi:hypothetical protein
MNIIKIILIIIISIYSCGQSTIGGNKTVIAGSVDLGGNSNAIITACGTGQRGDPSNANIIRCEPFEILAAHFDGTSTTPALVPIFGTSDYSKIVEDNSIFASGAGSMRMDIPAISGSDVSGAYFANFQNDLLWQLGAQDQAAPHEGFIQWRQRDDSGSLANIPQGRKLIDVAVGDYVSGYRATSCDPTSELEAVITHYGYALDGPLGTPPHIIPNVYTNCGTAVNIDIEAVSGPQAGTTSFQNRNETNCKHNINGGGTNDYTGCWSHNADEWATYEMHFVIGNWNTANSCVDIWLAHENAAPQLIISQCDVNFLNDDSTVARLGKVWFTPYTTGRNSGVTYSAGKTWYDDLIISKAFIPFPTQTIPQPPTYLHTTAVGSSSVSLAWTDNTGGTSIYKVSRCTNAPKYCEFGDTAFAQVGSNTAAGATTFTDSTVAVSTTYTYRVEDATTALSVSNDFQAVTPSTAMNWTQLSNTAITSAVWPVVGGSYSSADITSLEGHNGDPAKVTDYSGMVVADNGAAHARAEINGGGHASYGGNQTYEVDLVSSTITLKYGPTVPGVGGCDNTTWDAVACAVNIPFTTATGACVVDATAVNPNARHTYNTLLYYANIGNGDEGMLMFDGGATYCGQGGGSRGQAFTLDFGASTSSKNGSVWTRAAYTNAMNSSDIHSTAHIYRAGGTNGAGGTVYGWSDYNFGTYSIATSTFTLLVDYTGELNCGSSLPSVVDETNSKLVLLCPNAGKIYSKNLTSGHPADVTGTGCSTLLAVSASGITWDSTHNEIWAYQGWGNTVYRIDWNSGTSKYDCASVTVTGAPLASDPSPGDNIQHPWGRFQYVKSLDRIAFYPTAALGAWLLKVH